MRPPEKQPSLESLAAHLSWWSDPNVCGPVSPHLSAAWSGIVGECLIRRETDREGGGVSEKRKAGRPRVLKEPVKVLSLKLGADDLEAIDGYAASKGFNRSEAIRFLITKAAAGAVPAP